MMRKSVRTNEQHIAELLKDLARIGEELKSDEISPDVRSVIEAALQQLQERLAELATTKQRQ